MHIYVYFYHIWSHCTKLLEHILPKITELHQLRRRQGKGVKGEKELPPPPLLARPALRDSHYISSGLAPLGLRLPKKFSLKGKGKLLVFLAPPAHARKTFFLPKTNLAKMVENGQVQAGKSNFQTRFGFSFRLTPKISSLDSPAVPRRFFFSRPW